MIFNASIDVRNVATVFYLFVRRVHTNNSNQQIRVCMCPTRNLTITARGFNF